MPLIALSNYYSNEVLDKLYPLVPKNFSLNPLIEPTKKDLLNKISNAHYLIVGGRTKIDKEVLEQAKSLKMIQRTGVGLDSLDLDEIKKRNIPIYVNQGVNATSVAEHTIMLMLASLRNLVAIHNTLSKGIWKKHEFGIHNSELSGKTVGLIGLGNIGRKVAKLLSSFNVNLVYYKPNRLDKSDEETLNLNYVPLDVLYEKSDIITLHCSLNPSTNHIINSGSISKMKDGVIIINTSRGKLIHEKDLIIALDNKKISFAALDVFEEEPLNKESVLLQRGNVILTPHISGITSESFLNMLSKSFKNIELFDNGNLEQIKEMRLSYD